MELRYTDPLTRGPAVTHAERVLHGENKYHTNYHPGVIDGVYGQTDCAATREAKFHCGYRIRNCTTVYDSELDAILTGRKRLGAARRARRAARKGMTLVQFLKARRLRREAAKEAATLQARYVAMLKWGIDRAGMIHYTQDAAPRVAALTRWGHSLPLSTDCSGSVKAAAIAVGVPNWDGPGNVGFTGTILNLPIITRAQAQPGDFIVYGPGTGEHVVALMEPGSHADPLVFSHGQESGPMALRLSVESAAHPGAGLRWRRNPINR